MPFFAYCQVLFYIILTFTKQVAIRAPIRKCPVITAVLPLSCTRSSIYACWILTLTAQELKSGRLPYFSSALQ